MMKQRLFSHLGLLVALLIGACAPLSVTYFQPSPDSVTVTKAWCPPVASVGLLVIKDVTIGFELSSRVPGTMNVSITLEIPAGRSVQLQEQAIQLENAEGHSVRGTLTAWAWVGAGRTGEVPLDKPLMGKTDSRWFNQITRYGKTDHAYFMLTAAVDIEDSDSFQLKPPVLLVDGQSVELPVTTFFKVHETITTGLNC